MVQKLYFSPAFVSAIKDEKTDNIAYRLHPGTDSVEIIFTRSDDGLIRKIKYHVIRILFGYRAIDVSLHKEFYSRNVCLIFDAEEIAIIEGKIRDLKERLVAAQTQQNNVTLELSSLKSEKYALESDLGKKKQELEVARKELAAYHEQAAERGKIKGYIQQSRRALESLEKREDELQMVIQDLERGIAGLKTENPGSVWRDKKAGDDALEDYRSIRKQIVDLKNLIQLTCQLLSKTKEPLRGLVDKSFQQVCLIDTRLARKIGAMNKNMSMARGN